MLSVPSVAMSGSSYKHFSMSIIDVDDDNNDTNNGSDLDEVGTTNASSSDFTGGNAGPFPGAPNY